MGGSQRVDGLEAPLPAGRRAADDQGAVPRDGGAAGAAAGGGGGPGGGGSRGLGWELRETSRAWRRWCGGTGGGACPTEGWRSALAEMSPAAGIAEEDSAEAAAGKLADGRINLSLIRVSGHMSGWAGRLLGVTVAGTAGGAGAGRSCSPGGGLFERLAEVHRSC